MKFLRILFSRVTIIVLFIFFQIFFGLGILRFYRDYYAAYHFVNIVLAAVAIIHLINRDTNPDAKLPWVLVIIFMQLFGIILYMIFSNNYVSRKQRKVYSNIYANAKKYIEHHHNDDCIDEKVKSDLGEYYGQSQYVHLKAISKPYTNTNTKYFKCGEDFFEVYLNELKKAEKFIFMEYFIIDEGKMWDAVLDVLVEKANAGVEVRVMYDDIGSIFKLTSNYYKKISEKGINCIKFSPFTPFVSAVHNNRDHRKVTVCDGKVGFVGGINISDEYINEVNPFGYWKDSAVMLKGEGVKSLTLMFLLNFDAMAKSTKSYDEYLEIEFEKYDEIGYVQPFGDGPRPLYNDYISKTVYLNIINQAKKYVYITTPYLILDSELRSAITSAASRGVDVRIITPGIPDKKIIFNITRSNYKKLIQAGVKIYQFTPGFIHSKSIISDDVVGVVGTINLDYRSLIHHYECGVWMYKVEALSQLKEDVLKTIEVSDFQDETKAKQSLIQRLFSTLLAIFAPLL